MRKPWLILGVIFLAAGTAVAAVSQTGRHIAWAAGFWTATAVCWLLASRRRVTYTDEKADDAGRKP